MTDDLERSFNKKQRRQGSRLLKILSVGKASVSEKTDSLTNNKHLYTLTTVASSTKHASS